MREGYWINYATSKTFDINEHEMWLRVPGNAKKLGLPREVIGMFRNFKPVVDRDKFLMFVMKHAPVMRVRGHGTTVAFEYNSTSRRDPMDAIWIFGKENLGPFSTLYIVNFATNEKVEILFQNFEEAVDTGGYDAVMRVAKVQKLSIKKNVVAALLQLSKELLKQ